MPLPHPSAETRVLVSAAVRALRSIDRPGFDYVKAGVMLVDLQSSGQVQDTLVCSGPASWHHPQHRVARV